MKLWKINSKRFYFIMYTVYCISANFIFFKNKIIEVFINNFVIFIFIFIVIVIVIVIVIIIVIVIVIVIIVIVTVST